MRIFDALLSAVRRAWSWRGRGRRSGTALADALRDERVLQHPEVDPAKIARQASDELGLAAKRAREKAQRYREAHEPQEEGD